MAFSRTDTDARAYHHGDLRAAVLRGAVAEIAETGPAGLSLRQVARRVGVSHSAPQHHFGDKKGLLGAVAAAGYERLAEVTDEAWSEHGTLLDVGLAYVRFAVANRPYFAVMFRPELYRLEDPDVVAARERAAGVLFETVRRSMGDAADDEAVLAGVVGVWSFVHGFADLWLAGNFYPEVGDDPEEAARRAADSLRALASSPAFGRAAE